MDSSKTQHMLELPALQARLSREICAFLAEELELAPSAVRGDSRLVEDLAADSIVILALFDEIARRYGIRGNVRELAKEARGRKIATVDDLCSAMAEFLGSRRLAL